MCEEDYRSAEGGLCDEIGKEEWKGHWRWKGWQKAGGRSGLRPAHLKCLVGRGHWMGEVLRRLCNLTIRWGVRYTAWGVEVMWPLEKVPGVTDIEKQRPIKLLEVLRKCVSGVLQGRMDRGMEEMGLLDRMQSAFRRERSCEVSLMHMNLASEYAAVHSREMVDQGYDVKRAYDSVEAGMGKEMAWRRMGCGESYIQLQMMLGECGEQVVGTGFGLSDVVCEEAAQRGEVVVGEGEEEGEEWWRGNGGRGRAEIGLVQGGSESPSGWNCLMDMHFWLIREYGVDPLVVEAGGEQEEVWGAGFADDMRLYNSTLRGAQKSCDITADFHGVMGLEMACGKCWVRVLEWDEQGERVQRSTEEKAPHERVWYRRVESEEHLK